MSREGELIAAAGLGVSVAGTGVPLDDACVEVAFFNGDDAGRAFGKAS